jgi:hypothetical protein
MGIYSLNTTEFGHTFVMAAVVALLLWLGLRKASRWSFYLLVAGTYLGLRLLLFGNPVAWYAYYLALDVDKIDMREKDTIVSEAKKFFVPDQLKYLAVGQSQTWAIYRKYSNEHPDFVRYFELGGMTSVDMVGCLGRILEMHPEHVLLYLSGFDMSRQPQYSAIAFLPEQGFRIFSYVRELESLPPAPDKNLAIRELLIGELLPEVKYAFVFTDLFKQYVADPLGLTRTETAGDRTAQQLKRLDQLVDNANIGDMARFLEIFLSEMQRAGIKVTLIEGQYNPRSYTPKAIAFENDVMSPYLASLCGKYSNLHVWLRDGIDQFSQADYTDAYHVNAEAGYRFTEHVVDLLAQENGKACLNTDSHTETSSLKPRQ